MRQLISAMLVLSSVCFSQNKQLTLSGKIFNKSTGKPLPNCNIAVVARPLGAVSDSSGFFILHIPEGKFELKFSHVGFKTKLQEFYIPVKGNITNMVIEMEPSTIEENEVIVLGEKQRSTIERQKFEPQDVKNMPNLYSDAMRSIQILPGVTSNNELSNSYNVRGGNFDENLVYLDGFQIYRPFLLKQGIEENQSLINPAMLKDMQFFAGAFPARMGDKMSSALEINYQNQFQDSIHGNLRSDLLNLGASVNNHYKNLNWSLGFRYAYPGFFLNKLHTTGNYRPFFSDIQALLNYKLSEISNLELLFIIAENRFQFSPYDFETNYQHEIKQKNGFPVRNISAVRINFNGNSDYNFKTSFAGLRYNKNISENLKFSVGFSSYNTHETEFKDISSDIYYSEEVYIDHNPNYEPLKSSIQQADNSVKFISNDLQVKLSLAAAEHKIDIGLSANLTELDNRIFENSYETKSDELVDLPTLRDINTDFTFLSYTFYGQDEIRFGESLKLNVGARFLNYNYTGEKLLSPRTAIFYYPSKEHSLSFSWGYYYQPPIYYEYRNKINPAETQLKSQRAIFYVLGWDYFFKEKVKFQLQTYYKALDNLIPYYIEQLQLEYGNSNIYKGYAYGVDMQFQGEIIPFVQSWIGYSFLNTQERDKTQNTGYLRRFLDQTHTIQIFLQDKFRKHQNWQSHLRLVFGSGFLYPIRKAETDDLTGKQFISVIMDRRETFPFYMRADMGLTVNFTLFRQYDLRIIAEVLNVFDKQNIANYIWLQTFKDVKQPVNVPSMYSERFFNLGFDVNF